MRYIYLGMVVTLVGSFSAPSAQAGELDAVVMGGGCLVGAGAGMVGEALLFRGHPPSQGIAGGFLGCSAGVAATAGGIYYLRESEDTPSQEQLQSQDEEPPQDQAGE